MGRGWRAPPSEDAQARDLSRRHTRRSRQSRARTRRGALRAGAIEETTAGCAGKTSRKGAGRCRRSRVRPVRGGGERRQRRFGGRPGRGGTAVYCSGCKAGTDSLVSMSGSRVPQRGEKAKRMRPTSCAAGNGAALLPCRATGLALRQHIHHVGACSTCSTIHAERRSPGHAKPPNTGTCLKQLPACLRMRAGDGESLSPRTQIQHAGDR